MENQTPPRHRDVGQFGLDMSQPLVSQNRSYSYREALPAGTDSQKQPQLPIFGADRVLENCFPRSPNMYDQYGKGDGYQHQPYYGGTSPAYLCKPVPHEAPMVRGDPKADTSYSETISDAINVSDRPINATMKPDRAPAFFSKVAPNSSSSFLQPKLEPSDYPYNLVYPNIYRNQTASHNTADHCLENSSEKYHCGCCMLMFPKICLLHTHLQTHDCDGSYYYNQATKTAYPRLGSVCTSTQTDDLTWADLSNRSDDIETASNSGLDDSRGVKDVKTPITILSDKKKRKSAKTAKAEPVKRKTSADSKVSSKKTRRRRKTTETTTDADVKDEQEEDDFEETNVYVKVEAENEEDSAEEVDNDDIDDDEDYEAQMDEDSCDTDGYDVEDFADLDFKARKYNKTGKPRKKRTRAYLEYYTQKDKQFICKLCDDSFEGYRKFVRHCKESHVEITEPEKKGSGNPRSKPMECIWCGESFPSAKMCIDHVRECDANQRLKCQICDTRFPTVGDVKDHIPTHQNIELSCKKCTKAFTNAVYFHNHLLRHAEIKNVQCEHCGKYVNGGRTLANHLRNCSKEQNLPCPHCDRMFKTQHALKFHMAVHSEERPFVCHICGHAGRFFQTSVLCKITLFMER